MIDAGVTLLLFSVNLLINPIIAKMIIEHEIILNIAIVTPHAKPFDAIEFVNVFTKQNMKVKTVIADTNIAAPDQLTGL